MAGWLTVGQGVEGLPGDVQDAECGALGLRGPPACQGSLEGWGPVTDHPQGLALHRDDLTALRLGGVGVWLWHWTTGRQRGRGEKGNTTRVRR